MKNLQFFSLATILAIKYKTSVNKVFTKYEKNFNIKIHDKKT